MNHLASSQADGHADADDILREIAAVFAADSLEEILPGLRLVDDLGASDFDRRLLAANLQHRFDIRIPLSAVLAWRQVADVIACVHQLLAGERITS